MKTVYPILVFLFALNLAACAGGGGEYNAPIAPTPQKSDGDSPADPEVPAALASQDCGSEELLQCDLFGLRPDELRALRRIIPSHAPTMDKEKDLELIVSRAVVMTENIKRRFPHADTRISSHNRAKVISFYHSIPWM